MLFPTSFFDISRFKHKVLFIEKEPVWQALANLKNYMQQHSYPDMETNLFSSGTPLTETVIIHESKISSAKGKRIVYGDACKGKLMVYEGDKILEGATVIMAGAVLVGDQFDFGKGTLIESGALIKSPTIIGDYCEVRQGAYLRGNCLSGDRCVLGHTTEIKHSILLNDAKAGHFAYVGDSILGNNTNLGAGTKLANLRFIPGNITIRNNGQKSDSGLRKFGAILGDQTQTGCNSVTNPGTVFGKHCLIRPNTTAKSGYHPDGTIL